MVRLLTHNMLQCHVKGCSNGFPLRFEEPVIEHVEQEANHQFLISMLPRLDISALQKTAQQLGLTPLPDVDSDNMDKDDKFLEALHHLLMETLIQSGSMVCPECEHVYPIKDGIPNMLLSEEEV